MLRELEDHSYLPRWIVYLVYLLVSHAGGLAAACAASFAMELAVHGWSSALRLIPTSVAAPDLSTLVIVALVGAYCLTLPSITGLFQLRRFLDNHEMSIQMAIVSALVFAVASAVAVGMLYALITAPIWPPGGEPIDGASCFMLIFPLLASPMAFLATKAAGAFLVAAVAAGRPPGTA